MKSVLQSYGSGELKVVDSPTPQLRAGCALVRTSFSVISAGTEKTKVDMGSKSLLGKARSRPDLVSQVIAKARREGLWKTWQTVRDRLDTPSPLGYCSAGEVLETRGDVNGLKAGDRVACAGSTANHAEIVCVPKNLLVPVPPSVRLDHAAFATLGAIALQGVRQAEVRVGEKVAVIGLGLVGLLTVQILRAAGCRVFGIDIAPDKIQLSQKLGCAEAALAGDEALEERILSFTDGYGVDATIITAASSSNQPIEQAAEMTREKGRVVVVGLTRMELPREPFYLKELDLRLSRSYGPGRYDRHYEDEGLDYPYAYVRFTERRNMISFLELVEGGQVQLNPLITHRFPIDDAAKAYELLHGVAKEPYLAILLEYSRTAAEIPRRIELRPRPLGTGKIVLGVIGAGNYATANLLPVLRDNPAVSLGSVCTGSGVTGAHVAAKFGFAAADADIETVMRDSDALLIATRHSEHAELVIRALKHGKPVFVEKPLAITEDQLQQVIACFHSLDPRPSSVDPRHSSVDPRPSSFDPAPPQPSLTVGFNRRFAPATKLVNEHFSSVTGPRQVVIRVNAGAIPTDHWIQDPQIGGGRLIGEGCHFIDLAVALTGSMIELVMAVAVALPNKGPASRDSFSISLSMIDGSVATVIYASAGDTGLAKERVEMFGGGKAAVIDDFRRVELWQGGKKKQKSWMTQDKGQRQQMNAWINGLHKGRAPIPVDELINVHAACFAALRCIESGTTVRLPASGFGASQIS